MIRFASTTVEGQGMRGSVACDIGLGKPAIIQGVCRSAQKEATGVVANSLEAEVKTAETSGTESKRLMRKRRQPTLRERTPQTTLDETVFKAKNVLKATTDKTTVRQDQHKKRRGCKGYSERNGADVTELVQRARAASATDSKSTTEQVQRPQKPTYPYHRHTHAIAISPSSATPSTRHQSQPGSVLLAHGDAGEVRTAKIAGGCTGA